MKKLVSLISIVAFVAVSFVVTQKLLAQDPPKSPANTEKKSCCKAEEKKSCCKASETKSCCKAEQKKACCKDGENKSCCKTGEAKPCCKKDKCPKDQSKKCPKSEDSTPKTTTPEVK